ncbi:MAG: ribbon-helix-helix domain-containing protein [Alphaproteobacteria bacterium]
MKKYSINLQGHATSVSLEPEFWQELQTIAAARKLPISTLIAEIDANRIDAYGGNLSSALRVYVLKTIKLTNNLS